MAGAKAPRRAWIEWLYGELPAWEGDGLLAPGGAEGIKRRYGQIDRRSGMGAALIVFAVLGALSIGLGAILLFARNWRDLGRAERIILAFLPVAASLGLCAFTLIKRASSAAWKEASASFNLLALLGALALIGQTYHLGGDIDDLLFPWLILSLPTVYLLSSLSAWVMWVAGASVWAYVAQALGGQAAFYWVFIIAALPAFVHDLALDRRGARAAVRGWTLVLSLSVCLGVTLEKVMPGLWIVIYPGFFAVLSAVDLLWLEDGPGEAARPALAAPFRTAGFLGLTALAFVLSYTWPWEDIGWRYWRHGERFFQDLAWLDFLSTGLFLAASLALSAIAILRKKYRHFGLNLLPLVAAAGYLLVSVLSGGGDEASRGMTTVLAPVNLLMNAFILYSGVLMILSGSRRKKASDLNLGAFIIVLWVVLRFVFSEAFMGGLFGRGLVFIAIGAFFLVMNLIFSKKLKAEGEGGE